jgi:hypothetical protein
MAGVVAEGRRNEKPVDVAALGHGSIGRLRSELKCLLPIQQKVDNGEGQEGRKHQKDCHNDLYKDRLVAKGGCSASKNLSWAEVVSDSVREASNAGVGFLSCNLRRFLRQYV